MKGPAGDSSRIEVACPNGHIMKVTVEDLLETFTWAPIRARHLEAQTMLELDALGIGRAPEQPSQRRRWRTLRCPRCGGETVLKPSTA